MPAVITENDVSQWSDKTGSHYHFPKRYRTKLEPGTRVVYYKGKIKKPHYFGIAVVDEVYPDPESTKGDLYASLKNYQKFKEVVIAKQNNEHLEVVPTPRKANYWREGVREISDEVYERIVSLAEISAPSLPGAREEQGPYNVQLNDFAFYEEGDPSKFYGTRYERDPKLRQQAIEIHGLTCAICSFNFETVYGELGKGFIHIHHVVPVSTYGSSRPVDPKQDLVPLCPNCHAMVHRYKDKILSVDELKALLRR